MRWPWRRRRKAAEQESRTELAAARREYAAAERKDPLVKAYVDRMAEIREVNGLVQLFEAAFKEHR